MMIMEILMTLATIMMRMIMMMTMMEASLLHLPMWKTVPWPQNDNDNGD